MQIKYKFVQDNENYFKKAILPVLVLLKLVNSIDKNDIQYECQYLLHIIF